MAKTKKETVEIDGVKYKDGDKVTVVITGTLHVEAYEYLPQGTKEVMVSYGKGTYEFYLDDSEENKVQTPKGTVVVKR